MSECRICIIAGAQKAGTTTLFHWLTTHPQVIPAKKKELHYFDFNYKRGKEFYLSQFENKDGIVLLESSPYYLFHPEVPRRIKDQFPKANVVILLRDPIERAWSQYRMNYNRGIEKLDFRLALLFESIRTAFSSPDIPESRLQNYSYLSRSKYCNQIIRWLYYFERKQLFIAIFEDFYQNPQKGIISICEFLKINSNSIQASAEILNKGDQVPMPEHFRDTFGKKIKTDLIQLAKLITPDFGKFETWRTYQRL